MPALVVLAHHSEPSDPVLIRWMLDTFESLVGLGPTAIVIAVAVLLLAFPLGVAFLAIRARRAQDGEGEDDEAGLREGRRAK